MPSSQNPAPQDTDNTARRLMVIGGGAAGFFAALEAKSLQPTLDVHILEAAAQPLGKVKISGGGRCNVTHACFDLAQLVQAYPRGQKELRGIFARFGPADTVAWFAQHGVPLKTEADGRMFPATNTSQTVVDCLRDTAQRLGVTLHLKTPVQTVEKTPTGYRVQTLTETWEADVVILATGGSPRGHTWAQALGHRIVPPVPSLFTFQVPDPRLEGLAGVSVPHVVARLDVAGHKPLVQEGPLLITHWGLSGPAILRLSAWGARALHEASYQANLAVDLLPDHSQEDCRAQLLAQKAQSPQKHVANEFPAAWRQTLPKRLWERLLTPCDIDGNQPWESVPQKALNRLSETLKRAVFPVRGKGVFKEEFVTAGGVALADIDCRTMESRHSPGLYFAGEILDIDGITGGFNFQNAWATGWLAGQALGRQT